MFPSHLLPLPRPAIEPALLLRVMEVPTLTDVLVGASMTNSLNVAAFHPVPGGGFVYGTDTGVVRAYKVGPPGGAGSGGDREGGFDHRDAQDTMLYVTDEVRARARSAANSRKVGLGDIGLGRRTPPTSPGASQRLRRHQSRSEAQRLRRKRRSSQRNGGEATPGGAGSGGDGSSSGEVVVAARAASPPPGVSLVTGVGGDDTADDPPSKRQRRS